MNKRIGIVGFGIVGKSALRFLRKHHSSFHISIWDKRDLHDSEKELIATHKASYFSSSQTILEDFFASHDQLIMSPGIDIRLYEHYNDKMVGELDLFSSVFCKKTIAITGTLGKTTVTKLLGALLENVLIGGNVGTGMLDLVAQQEKIAGAILELSSFQLDYNKTFAPDIAVMTNFYPNHLDRHGTIEAYFGAKCKLFQQQSEHQKCIISIDILKGVFGNQLTEKLEACKAQQSFVKNEPLSCDDLKHEVLQGKHVFYVKDDCFCRARVRNGALVKERVLFDMRHLPATNFLENWLFVLSTLHEYGYNLQELERVFDNKQFHRLSEHRLERFATINGIDFYNDSKATIMEATKAALCRLDQNGRPIILVIGGLGKGVDRSPLVQFFSFVKNIKLVFCLGDGCSEFKAYPSYASLQELVHVIMQCANKGDQVLFSPSGASFDLFDNYMHRGEKFKELVLKAYGNTG